MKQGMAFDDAQLYRRQRRRSLSQFARRQIDRHRQIIPCSTASGECRLGRGLFFCSSAQVALDNTCGRVTLTPAGVKVIRIHDKRGRVIECSDAKEAITVLEYLEREEEKVIRRRMPGANGLLEAIAAMVGGTDLPPVFGPVIM